jgi:hypothetical protein
MESFLLSLDLLVGERPHREKIAARSRHSHGTASPQKLYRAGAILG